jgi:hypothetical protein
MEDTPSVGCSRLKQWLGRNAQSDHQEPPDELVLHTSACVHCRGVLLTLLLDRVASPPPIDERHCEEVADRLPEFVDYEQIYGSDKAIQAYPDIWWNILVCPDCHELYQALTACAALPQIAWNAQPVAAPRPQTRVRAHLTIHATALRQFLALQSSLGAAWGAPDDGMIIAEHREATFVLNVALRTSAPGTFMLVVTTKPPISGGVRLRLEGTPLHADFDDTGRVVFAELQAADFADASAADLHLVIESIHQHTSIDDSDP